MIGAETRDTILDLIDREIIADFVHQMNERCGQAEINLQGKVDVFVQNTVKDPTLAEACKSPASTPGIGWVDATSCRPPARWIARFVGIRA